MPKTTVTIDELIGWLRRFQELVARDRGYLTGLDSAIGDADHGANMSRGMSAVVERLRENPPATIEELFKNAGMTLVSTVGGASGPLYGTFFLRFGTAAGAVSELDAVTLGAALRAGMEGVVARGKAETGDKTMLDAISPALAAYDEAIAGAGETAAEGAHAASEAARRGRDATGPMIARKGRASYLGERSTGHLDPGAASAALLFEALDETLAEQ